MAQRKCKVVEKLPVTMPVKITRKNNIPTLAVSNVQEKNIIFSYKYFNCQSLKNDIFNNCFFSIGEYAKWITIFLKKISNYSSMQIGELMSAGKSTRFHPVKNFELIKLKEILKSINVDCDKIFSQEEGNQFYELSVETGQGRLFGYLIENIYYILLFDPNHLIYMNTSKGGKQDLLHKRYDPWEDQYIAIKQ